MSCGYAEGLSHYENKGKLGGPEMFDTDQDIDEKVNQLAILIKQSKHTVVHTGAGISTSAGIPDFRGPNGVWTLEKLGKKPVYNTSWDDAEPTFTHMALVSLEKAGLLQYIVSQNIDGLHLKSFFPRKKLAELHGNMFIDKCNMCNRQFVRHTASKTIARKTENVPCPGRKINGRKCRGRLFDTILDWEDSLPENDLQLSSMHSCAADLSLCLGTTLQIDPSGKLPVDTKKRGGKVVVCNLQATKHDRHADIILHGFVDDIMKKLLSTLKIDFIGYSPTDDPIRKTRQSLEDCMYKFDDDVSYNLKWPDNFVPIDWTLEDNWLKNQPLIANVTRKNELRKKLRQEQRNKISAKSLVKLKIPAEEHYYNPSKKSRVEE